ncbi:MAG TPA: hypothetical protein VJT73_19605, partial [Polyangiaceae bacterium]|nr:hypothetical protein [Polyangiaceae bacterium]
MNGRFAPLFSTLPRAQASMCARAFPPLGWTRLSAFVLVLSTAPSARAAKVTVTAGTRIEASAARDPSVASGVVIRGTLRDDVGAPVPTSHVEIAFYVDLVGAPPGQGAALALPAPRPCSRTTTGGPDAHEPHVAPDAYVVDTDALGTFCIATALPTPRATMKLRFAGSLHLEPTAAEVPVDLALSPAALAFDPAPAIVSLDRPAFIVSFRVTTTGIAKNALRVSLRDERDRALGTGAVDTDGSARIEVATQDLAGPGSGEFRAALEGEGVAPSVVVHRIERHARAEIEIVDLHPEGAAEEGIPIAVRVRSPRGPVPSGSVEITAFGRAVGTSSVRDGRADVVATFSVSRASSVPTSLRYLPDAPWWEPGSARHVNLTARPTSPWRRLPLLLLGALLAIWMLRGSLRRRLWRARPPLPDAPAPPTGLLQVVRPLAFDEGWTGRVADAHDGYPVRKAKVSIVLPAFPGALPNAGTLAETVTDYDGRFAVDAKAARGGAAIRVEAPWHCTFEQALPPPSELAIPMLARKRRLVARLVEWAAAEWGPWGTGREPTPRQVAARVFRKAGGSRGAKDDPAVARAAAVRTWAEAVESAAYGPDGVDEETERAVLAREPRNVPRP